MRGTFPVLVAVVKDQGPLGGDLTVCWVAEMEGRTWDGKGDGLHLALPIHHSQPILVVFQVEESVLSRPNHHGRRLQDIGAGVEHLIPNTEIHGESGPEK